MSGEEDLIRWLKRQAAGRGGELIGDDAAILPSADFWAITMDTQVEGVHFPSGLTPATVAHRLLRVNLSDLAAMGALPAYAFLALSAPPGFDHRAFLSALIQGCEVYDLQLAGGDTAQNQHLMTALTLLGRKAEQRWLKRSTARPGELLWIGGTLGESAAGLALLQRGASPGGDPMPAALGLPPAAAAAAARAIARFLQPEPQLALGRWLGTCAAGAAIDISDGLAKDLRRLCAASGVGAEVELERLPVSADFIALATRLELPWQDLVLGGGEDYVLLFTLPPQISPPQVFGCVQIGQIIAAERVDLIVGRERLPMPRTGWDHLDGKLLA